MRTTERSSGRVLSQGGRTRRVRSAKQVELCNHEDKALSKVQLFCAGFFSAPAGEMAGGHGR